MTRKGGFGCLELCLYGIRELASATSWSSIWVSDLECSTLQVCRSAVNSPEVDIFLWLSIISVAAVSKEVFTFPPGLKGPMSPCVSHGDGCSARHLGRNWAERETEMLGHSSAQLHSQRVKTHTGPAPSLPPLTRIITGLSLSDKCQPNLLSFINKIFSTTNKQDFITVLYCNSIQPAPSPALTYHCTVSILHYGPHHHRQ